MKQDTIAGPQTLGAAMKKTSRLDDLAQGICAPII